MQVRDINEIQIKALKIRRNYDNKKLKELKWK